jgi:hypothetical protein
MFEFHKELKLFVLKALLKKLFQTSHYYLKDFTEKTKYQNVIFFLLFKTQASLLAKE